jgi:hypothetical protein
MVLVLLEHLLMQIVENLREVLVYCVLTDILLGMMANVRKLVLYVKIMMTLMAVVLLASMAIN